MGVLPWNCQCQCQWRFKVAKACSTSHLLQDKKKAKQPTTFVPSPPEQIKHFVDSEAIMSFYNQLSLHLA